jgi:DNA-binding GntR family transcriptional regulator
MKIENPDKLTLTETAYKYIFDGILNGRYRAGQSISPDNIVKSLNMSKTPVREALVQLEVEGLVFRNGRFYNVIFLDENEVLELYEIRGILESEATYLATKKLKPEILEELKTTLELIKRLNQDKEPEPIKLADLNGKFHSIIAKGSGNRYISEYTAQVRLKLKVIRTALFSSSDRRLSEIREHEDVLRAMESGNAEEARDRMKSHVGEVIEYLKNNVLNRIY